MIATATSATSATPSILEATKAAMASNDFTCSEVARAIGYSPGSLSGYLGGKYGANPTKMSAIVQCSTRLTWP